MLIAPKNWADFQHYKDRAPPWIKLHKGLLDNYEFQCLPVASRALAPMLWLLASDHERGEIDAAPKKLAFRLRMTELEVNDALKPLIDNGFFLVIQDASGVLADRKQGADLETETEKRKKETEQRARDFETFWAAYPKKDGKRDAESAWAKVDAPIAVILAAVSIRAKSEDWTKSNGQFVPLAATYLRGRRWEDAGTIVTAPRRHDSAEETARMLADMNKNAAAPSIETLERMARLRQGVKA